MTRLRESIGLARAGRFSPRADDPTIGLDRLQVVVPAAIAAGLRVGVDATARDIGLLWRMISEESRVWSIRSVDDTTEAASLPLPLVTTKILRRGSERAVVETLTRLSRAECSVEGESLGPACAGWAIVGSRNARSLTWHFAPALLAALRDTSLEKRKVAPFARLELRVASFAKTKWTAAIYTRLVVEAIKRRRLVDKDGWSTAELNVAWLIASIGWSGAARPQDFIHQVWKPVISDLSGASKAAPTRLRIEVQPLDASARRTVSIKVRLMRLNRFGQSLDKPLISENDVQEGLPIKSPSGQHANHSPTPAARMVLARGKKQGFVRRS